MVLMSLKNALFHSRTANFGPQNCQTQVYSGSQINGRGNIMGPCSHDMTTHDDQYQYGSVENASLFQS